MAAPHMIFQDIVDWKKEARAVARAARAGRDPALGTQLAEHLLREMPPPPGAIVGGVWPLPGEIDLRPLLGELFARGHRIALPVTTPRGHAMHFREWTPESVMVPGRFGTTHTEGADLVPEYILVPLLAFDRKGNRLGYGAGHYDRTLAGLPDAAAVGFGFACQEVPALQVEPTDRVLDAIVTETELIRVGRE